MDCDHRGPSNWQRGAKSAILGGSISHFQIHQIHTLLATGYISLYPNYGNYLSPRYPHYLSPRNPSQIYYGYISRGSLLNSLCPTRSIGYILHPPTNDV